MKNKLKDIPGHEGRYSITRDGRVWSYNKLKSGNAAGKGFKRARWLASSLNSVGYPCVNLDGKTTPIHRLVASTYIKNVNNYRHVNHIDNNKKNNQVSNLEWCTQKHNVRHAIIGGFRINLKITKITGKKILSLYKSGVSVKKIAMTLGMKPPTVYGFLQGRKLLSKPRAHISSKERQVIKKSRGHTSIYRGVTYDKARKRYRAIIRIKGKDFRAGDHISEKNAARAYDKKAKELLGVFAKTNF